MRGYTREELALLWLSACAGLDERTHSRLLRACGHSVPPEQLQKICASVIQTDANRVYKDDATAQAQLEQLLAALEREGIFCVTLCSGDYPDALRAIPDPPLVLYGMGRRELLAEKKFCIVGSRMLPPWAAKTGKAIAAELCSRFCIVTGIAEGGDRAAIDGALSAGTLICVLPCGLDIDYPASHAALKREIVKRGLLLSEYPLGVRAQKFSFHARNRILAGLAEGVLVLAAAEKSGALITANCALSYGREVFALPHNVGTAQGVGCNSLIKQGAYLATDAGDIFDAFGMIHTAPVLPALTEEEQALLSHLRDAGEAHAAVLAQMAGVPVWEAQATLASLELKGLAVRSGGNRYAPLNHH